MVGVLYDEIFTCKEAELVKKTEIKDDGFTETVCEYCRQKLHKTEVTSWVGGKSYHTHHAKYHKQEVKAERLVPRLVN